MVRRLSVLGVLVALLAGCGGARRPTTTVTTIFPLPASNYRNVAHCDRPVTHCVTVHEPVTPIARSLTHPTNVAVTRRVPLVQPVNGAGKAVGGPVPSPVLLKPSEGCCGLTAKQIDIAYGVAWGSEAKRTEEEAQTVGIYGLYALPWLERQLSAYSTEMGLPECSKSVIRGGAPCFRQYLMDGSQPRPRSPREADEAVVHKLGPEASVIAHRSLEDAFELEASMDVESAHAMCHYCKIIFMGQVGAGPLPEHHGRASIPAWAAGMNELKALGATVASYSYGLPEQSYANEVTSPERTAVKTYIEEQNAAINAKNFPILVASGDGRYEGETYNAGKPHWEGETGLKEGGSSLPSTFSKTVSVGGTYLKLNVETGLRESELTWPLEGSGCSITLALAIQTSVSGWAANGCGSKREDTDIAADGSGESAFAVLSHVFGWRASAGTSLSAPLVAGMWAVAGSGHGENVPAETLYSHAGNPTYFFDVTSGTNAKCTGTITAELCSTVEASATAACQNKLVCKAGTGYDGPTGLGVPTLAAFKP